MENALQKLRVVTQTITEVQLALANGVQPMDEDFEPTDEPMEVFDPMDEGR